MGKQGGRDRVPWSLQLERQQSDLTQKVPEAHMHHVRPKYEHTIFPNWHASSRLARQPDSDGRQTWLICANKRPLSKLLSSHCRNSTVKTGVKWIQAQAMAHPPQHPCNAGSWVPMEGVAITGPESLEGSCKVPIIWSRQRLSHQTFTAGGEDRRSETEITPYTQRKGPAEVETGLPPDRELRVKSRWPRNSGEEWMHKVRSQMFLKKS